jgi:uncharacterized integral membrane protein
LAVALLAVVLVVMMNDEGYEWKGLLSISVSVIWFFSNAYFNIKSHSLIFKNHETENELLDYEQVMVNHQRFKGQIGIGVVIILLSVLFMIADYFMYHDVSEEVTYEESMDYLFPVIIGFLGYLAIASPIFVIWTWIKTSKAA